MKKLLFILPAFFFTLIVNVQQTEDEVYVGKGKTFGNYKGTGIIILDFGKKAKQTSVQSAITGIVISVSTGKADSLAGRGEFNFITVKKDDGTVVTIGTRDNVFTVPRTIVGRTITIDGSQVAGGRRRRDQQDIQYGATGIMVID